MTYRNRTHAGRELARLLEPLRDSDPVVLALPRGGVPVAVPVAAALHAPLDLILVRKLGLPHHRELAFGALGEGGEKVLNENVLARARLTDSQIAAVERAESVELARRAAVLRPGGARVPLRGRTAVIVDDGIATGATMIAACRVARAAGAARVVAAAPVVARDTVLRIEEHADEVVCPLVPGELGAVGSWYRDFTQVSEAEVVALLDKARRSTDTGR